MTPLPSHTLALPIGTAGTPLALFPARQSVTERFIVLGRLSHLDMAKHITTYCIVYRIVGNLGLSGGLFLSFGLWSFVVVEHIDDAGNELRYRRRSLARSVIRLGAVQL